jgi:hypothetical protein
MVAIGLTGLPLEIQLEIAQLAKKRQALKALSLTCRSLRNTVLSVLFEKVRLYTEWWFRGSINDLLANPQICASIRFLWLGSSEEDPSHGYGEYLLGLRKRLPELFRLRAVEIDQVDLSKELIDAFLETASRIPLRVHLVKNTYPLEIGRNPSAYFTSASMTPVFTPKSPRSISISFCFVHPPLHLRSFN